MCKLEKLSFMADILQYAYSFNRYIVNLILTERTSDLKPYVSALTGMGLHCIQTLKG